MDTTRLHARESVAFDHELVVRDTNGDPVDITGWTFALVLTRQAGTADITLAMASGGSEGMEVIDGAAGVLRIVITAASLQGVSDTTGAFTLYGDLLGTPPAGSQQFVGDIRLEVTVAGETFGGSTYQVVLDAVGAAIFLRAEAEAIRAETAADVAEGARKYYATVAAGTAATTAPDTFSSDETGILRWYDADGNEIGAPFTRAAAAADTGAGLIGTLSGLTVEQLLALGLPTPEWEPNSGKFVGDENGGVGPDNADAIEACLDKYGVCLAIGKYGISRPVQHDGNNRVILTPGCGAGGLYTLPDFTGTEMVKISATRASIAGLNVIVTSDVFDYSTYDPGSPPARVVDGIVAEGTFYHQYLDNCRVFGARRGINWGSLELGAKKLTIDNCYDGIRIEPLGGGTGYDQSLTNTTVNNCRRYGVYSERGIEAVDLHIVRAEEAALMINGGVPVKAIGLRIDRAKKYGLHLVDCNQGWFPGIDFTHHGAGRTFIDSNTGNPIYYDYNGGAPRWLDGPVGSGAVVASPTVVASNECRYFMLERSRDNEFTGAGIYLDNAIYRDDHRFLSVDVAPDGNPSTGLADTNRSIRNDFRKFHTANMRAIRDDADQRKFARWQRWAGNTGTAGRFNNEGLAHVGETLFLAAGGSRVLSFPIPNIDMASGGSLSMAKFDYSLRRNDANREFGIGVLPIVRTADTGNKNGRILSKETEGTVPLFTFTNIGIRTSVAGSRTTTWLDVTVNNTDGTNSGTIQVQVYPILDNQGPD